MANKKENKKRSPSKVSSVSSDQLGENASEEYRSESYANADRKFPNKKGSR